MRHFLAAAILLLVAQPDPALGQSAQIPTTIPEMWNAWCARCHARDGTGKLENRPVPIEPLDAVTFVGVAVGLGFSAALATAIPALRAARVDPVEAFRNE